MPMTGQFKTRGLGIGASEDKGKNAFNHCTRSLSNLDTAYNYMTSNSKKNTLWINRGNTYYKVC